MSTYLRKLWRVGGDITDQQSLRYRRCMSTRVLSRARTRTFSALRRCACTQPFARLANTGREYTPHSDELLSPLHGERAAVLGIEPGAKAAGGARHAASLWFGEKREMRESECGACRWVGEGKSKRDQAKKR